MRFNKKLDILCSNSSSDSNDDEHDDDGKNRW